MGGTITDPFDVIQVAAAAAAAVTSSLVGYVSSSITVNCVTELLIDKRRTHTRADLHTETRDVCVSQLQQLGSGILLDDQNSLLCRVVAEMVVSRFLVYLLLVL